VLGGVEREEGISVKERGKGKRREGKGREEGKGKGRRSVPANKKITTTPLLIGALITKWTTKSLHTDSQKKSSATTDPIRWKRSISGSLVIPLPVRGNEQR